MKKGDGTIKAQNGIDAEDSLTVDRNEKLKKDI